jgi:hypothetical protein
VAPSHPRTSRSLVLDRSTVDRRLNQRCLSDDQGTFHKIGQTVTRNMLMALPVNFVRPVMWFLITA